ncbi:RNA/RNP complex-1-interacting phosphatase homolog [Dysidea avara]|uniref:RNA/RNP complex-1-interacting phosphatase homolog n=1 Tax=Dysidea avara TaxID=196820 RepID=UPI00331FBFAC
MYRIPERWFDYSRFGELIGDTCIMASKTPLKSDFHQCKMRPEGVPPSEEFTPRHLVDNLQKKGQKLGLVVDLTFTSRYYNPAEFLSFGVRHNKVACPGQEVPSVEVYNNFAQVLKSHLAAEDPGVVAVHCTHGVNRTGYLVCKFLIDHFKYTADGAIQAFNKARSHKIERENYLSDLQEHWESTQQGGKTENQNNSKVLSANDKSAQHQQEYWQPLPQHYNDYYNSGHSFCDDWYPYQRHDLYQERGWVRRERDYQSYSRGFRGHHSNRGGHSHKQGGKFNHPYSQQKRQFSGQYSPPRNYPPNPHTYQHSSRPRKPVRNFTS